jgi:hypothetical protein
MQSRKPAAMRTFVPLLIAVGLMVLLVSAAWAVPL